MLSMLVAPRENSSSHRAGDILLLGHCGVDLMSPGFTPHFDAGNDLSMQIVLLLLSSA